MTFSEINFLFFFKKKKKLQGHYQTVANDLYPDQDRRFDGTEVLTSVQTICKGYQQTIKVAAGKERVNKTKGIMNIQ